MALLLLVEDDPRIRSALIRALTERGHAVASESTGMGGLRHAVDEVPDLVSEVAEVVSPVTPDEERSEAERDVASCGEVGLCHTEGGCVTPRVQMGVRIGWR